MIALDPNETFEVALADGTRVACHYMTARQFAKLDRITDQAMAEPVIDKKIDHLEEAISLASPVITPPLAAGVKLGDALTIEQLWDIANGIFLQSRLTQEDKKKSASQSASAAVTTSADSAPASAV